MLSQGPLAAVHQPSRSAVDCCFACSCKPGSIFADLDADSLMELDRRRQASIYPAGATVFLQDDQPRAIYCVGTGRVKLSHGTADGRSIALGIAAPGDVLGVRPMLLGTAHDHAAETLEETRLCFIPKQDFLDFLARNSTVSLRLARKLSAELDEAYRQVSGAALKSTTQRVAELILALSRAQDSVAAASSLSTRMCQDELAEFLGVSRRSLSRALAALRNRGLIECRRRLIVVRDSAALRKSLASLTDLDADPPASLPQRALPKRQMAHS